MKSADAPSLSERVDRFLRWFFNAAPEVVEPLPPRPVEANGRSVARRKPTPLRPQHPGPVRVAVKGKP